MAVLPYLVIKIAWTFGLFLPAAHMGEPSWRVINAVTVVVALIGIGLAFAFAMPWGERLPTWLVALPIWIGTGLLVPMLILAPVLGPAAMSRDQDAGAADVWVYEQVLVMVSLVGAGIGLPLALTGYVRARWPEALGGPLAVESVPGHSRQLQRTLAGIVAVGCILLAAVKGYWAAGGTLGLNPEALGHRDLWWHVLSLSTSAWALAGAWGLLSLVNARWSGTFVVPMVTTWVASGMLFSYSLYAALSGTRPDSPPVPEHDLPQVLTTQAGTVLGVLMALTLLLVLQDRRYAIRGRS